MQQRTAVLVGIGMAACAAAAVILLSARLAEDQRAERHAYQQALAEQRRATGRPLPAARTPGPPRPAGELCVRGVDGFAESLRTALPAAGGDDALHVLDDAGRLDVSAFVALSDLALRAERWVEQARGAPALPQRMGRTRAIANAAGDPAERSAGEPAWEPLQPARSTCGSGEAYAAVPLDLGSPAARPERAPESSAGSSDDVKREARPGAQRGRSAGSAAARRGR